MCRGIRIIVRFVHVIPSLVTIFDEAMLKDSRMLSFLLRSSIDCVLHGKNHFFFNFLTHVARYLCIYTYTYTCAFN